MNAHGVFTQEKKQVKMKKNLRLAVVGTFVRNCIEREKMAYNEASLQQRRQMTGIIRHLRLEVGMSQRVQNRV